MDEAKLEAITYTLKVISKWLGVSFGLYDESGNPVTLRNEKFSLTDHSISVAGAADFKERLLQYINKTSNLNQTVFYEIYPRLMITVTPLRLSKTYYLVGGYYASTRDLSDEKTPYLDNKKKEWFLRELEDVQRHLLGLVNYLETIHQLELRDEVMDKLRVLFLGSSPHHKAVFQSAELLRTVTPFSLMGIAAPVQNQRYKVKYVDSQSNEKWLDYEFGGEEGFLGWGSLTGQPMKWDDITQDPRYASCDALYDKVKSLAAFPLIFRKEVVGLFFVASERDGMFTESIINFFKGVLPFYTNLMIVDHYETKVQYMSKKVSILMGISQLLTTNIEPSRALGIVVDFLMSMDGVQQSFGVILSPSKDKIKELVGRGISVEEIKHHCNALLKQDLNEIQTDRQMFFPITIDGDTVGWFFIASKDTINKKDFLFTSTMVSVAANVLKGAYYSDFKSEESILDAFHTLIRLKDENLHQHILRVKEIVEMVCNQLNMDEPMKEVAVEAASIHELGTLVMEGKVPNMKMLHQPEQSNRLLWAASLLHRFPSLRPLAVIIEMYHRLCVNSTTVNGMEWEGNEDVLLAAHILHASDAFDAITQGDSWEEIVNALQKMEDSDINYHPQVINALNHIIRRRYTVEVSDVLLEGSTVNKPGVLDTLSVREKEVLSLIVAGQSNKEIAYRLRISEHTVKNHISNIFGKVNVSDRTSLVSLAYKQGFSK